LPRYTDHTGERYGSLTVLHVDSERTTPEHRYWRVRCDCGEEITVTYSNMKIRKDKSCGCKTGLRRKAPVLHGRARSAEYNAWWHIKDRCSNPKAANYQRYGGRGITVADEWLDNFQAFYDHVGPRPSAEHSLDRLDVNGNYEPGNVRWATPVEQARNRRNNILATLNGETKCLAEWCNLLGVKHGTMMNRIQKGWSPERALLTPIRSYSPANHCPS